MVNQCQAMQHPGRTLFAVSAGALFVLVVLIKGWRQLWILEHQPECQAWTRQHSKEPVPKIIHQIWLSVDTFDDLRPYYKENSRNCMALNPGYTHMFWVMKNATQFIEDNYAWFLPTFKEYNSWWQRDNAIRYFVLYHYGGVYIELKTHCMVPFDQQLLSMVGNHSAMFPLYHSHVAHFFMVAKKNHPFMHQITTGLLAPDMNYFLPYLTVPTGLGGMYVTRIHHQYPCKEQVHLIPDTNHIAVSYHGGTWFHFKREEEMMTVSDKAFILFITSVTCISFLLYFCYCRKESPLKALPVSK